jgi:ankyrin repeat protein/beta-lactamase regulating signal transducer with metallopeptidase domain
MTSLVEFFSQPVWHCLSLTLVHFLWQGVVTVIIACTTVRVLRLRHGNPRYVAYLCAFAIMAACPLVTFTILGTPVAPTTLTAGPTVEIESASPARPSVSPEPPRQLGEDALIVGPAGHAPLGDSLNGVLQASLPWALVCWMAGVLVLSVRLLLGFIGVRRWHRDLGPLPEQLAARVRVLSERLGLSGFSRVFLSGRAMEAVALGYLRPMVLLPAATVTHMSPEMLEAVIAHELAHIRRLDLWVNLAQRVVETLLFYHPAVWWLSNRLRAERELCCDELAVKTTGERLAYASALENATTARLAARQPALALGLARGRHSTLGRVRHILGLPPAPADSRPWLAGAIAFVILAVLTVPAAFVLAARTQSPTIPETAGNRVESLHDAIASNDIEEVKRLIAGGADVNAKNEQGYTPLTLGIASQGARIKEVAELLINAGADVNARGGLRQVGWEARTPLHWATSDISRGTAIIPLLLDRGANVNLTAERGMTPLHFAVDDENLEAVRLLIDKGADFNLKNQEGWTAFSGAALRGRTDMTDLFLHKGVDTSSFHMAAFTGNLSRVKELVETGTDVDTKDEFGWTALFWAACAGQTTVAEYLIEKKADLGAQDASGHSLLHQAARTRTDAVRLVELLIAKGADVNARNARGDTPLHLACYSNVAELLIAKGADVNAKNRTGYTALHSAASANHLEVAELLISKGADVDAGSEIAGSTPLLDAVIPGNTDMVRLLIDKGADVNVNTPVGTPLGFAVMGGHADIVKLLVAKGANVNARSSRGVTPLDLAEGRGNAEIIAWLRKHGAEKGSPTLLGAVTSGDIEQVKSLIAQGADVNAKDGRGRTLLHLACMRTNKEITHVLIDNGADVGARDNAGATPLHMAAFRGQIDAVRLLLAAGADVNARSNRQQTALSAAKAGGHDEIAALLLQHGAKEDSAAGQSDAKPAKSLHDAVAVNNVEEVKRLIAGGADVNAKNERGFAPLNWGVYRSSLSRDVAELLIDAGADVNAQDDTDGLTALHGAIFVEMGTDLIRLLVDKGANVNLTTKKGWTPLHYAVEMENPDIVRLLVDKGADFNLKNQEGWTPFSRAALHGRTDMTDLFLAKGVDTSSLHMAAFAGDLSRVRELVETGTQVDTKDEFGWTALFWAACSGQTEVAQFLIENKADLGAQDASGGTLLHQAAQARTDAVKLVELLIAKGADMNAKTNSARGAMPLHLACLSGNKEVAALLISKGADVNSRDNNGETPLHFAALANDVDLAELLISKGAAVNAELNTRITRYTPLHLAAMTDADMVEFLIEHGADVKASSGAWGRAPLHQAVIVGKTDIVRLLLDKGADVNAPDRRPGLTPLAWAVRNGHAEIVELLIAKGANVNARDSRGASPLGLAEERGNAEIIELLREHGAKE